MFRVSTRTLAEQARIQSTSLSRMLGVQILWGLGVRSMGCKVLANARIPRVSKYTHNSSIYLGYDEKSGAGTTVALIARNLLCGSFYTAK